MIIQWIVFAVTALLLTAALLYFTAAVIGVYRFGFVLNRMHAAGIGDSLGLLCAIAAVMIATGFRLDSLKLMLLIVFMWFTSPVSSHFLSQVEYYTNAHLTDYAARIPEKTESGNEEETEEDRKGAKREEWK